MKLLNGYWWGDFGNHWDASVFSESEAAENDRSLKGCSACLNCRDCSNCHGLEHGVNCADIAEFADGSNPFVVD